MAIFCSQALAARIERVEKSLLEGVFTATAAGELAAGHFALPLAGGVAVWCGEGSPVNKVAGLGFGGPLEVGELAALEARYAAMGATLRVELASLAEPEIGALLTRRGYVLLGYENVLGTSLPTTTAVAVGSEWEIAPIAPAEKATWLEVLVEGFATPDAQGVGPTEEFPREAVSQVIDAMTQAEGFTRFLARYQGQIVAGGSLRLAEGIAQLTGAATLPHFRRRGAQTALLHHRLELAGRAGCDLAIITTQPGSKSQENAQRRGFELLYTRAILELPPAAVDRA